VRHSFFESRTANYEFRVSSAYASGFGGLAFCSLTAALGWLKPAEAPKAFGAKAGNKKPL